MLWNITIYVLVQILSRFFALDENVLTFVFHQSRTRLHLEAVEKLEPFIFPDFCWFLIVLFDNSPFLNLQKKNCMMTLYLRVWVSPLFLEAFSGSSIPTPTTLLQSPPTPQTLCKSLESYIWSQAVIISHHIPSVIVKHSPPAALHLATMTEP